MGWPACSPTRVIVVSPGSRHERWPASERAELIRRHPWQKGALEDLEAVDPSPLRRSLIAARAAQRGLSVTIDARALGPGVGGTQTYVGALLLALGEVDGISVRAVLAPDAPADLRAGLRTVGVDTIDYEHAAAGVPRTDVVHRPQQVFTPHDLRLLRMLGERIVVSHMDLISFRAPAYHPTLPQWHDYRRVTRLALAAADRVVFFSDHARRDAIGEALVTPERSAVVGIGLQASAQETDEGARRPRELPPGREFVLALGADYAHKNRPFALQAGRAATRSPRLERDARTGRRARGPRLLAAGGARGAEPASGSGRARDRSRARIGRREAVAAAPCRGTSVRQQLRGLRPGAAGGGGGVPAVYLRGLDLAAERSSTPRQPRSCPGTRKPARTPRSRCSGTAPLATRHLDAAAGGAEAVHVAIGRLPAAWTPTGRPSLRRSAPRLRGPGRSSPARSRWWRSRTPGSISSAACHMACR